MGPQPTNYHNETLPGGAYVAGTFPLRGKAGKGAHKPRAFPEHVGSLVPRDDNQPATALLSVQCCIKKVPVEKDFKVSVSAASYES